MKHCSLPKKGRHLSSLANDAGGIGEMSVGWQGALEVAVVVD